MKNTNGLVCLALASLLGACGGADGTAGDDPQGSDLTTTEHHDVYIASATLGPRTAVAVLAPVAATCSDAIANGDEDGVDCGGSCAPCPVTPTVTPPDTPPDTPPPSTGSVRIMPLGDSITLGVNGGYRDGLWSRLSAAGRTVDFVGSQSDQYTKAPDHDHEGHPGFTIGDIAASADGWLASATPTHVLLMVGTNDVAWWSAQTGSQIADRNAALIDQILADVPGVWVLVGTIPPLTSSIIQPNNIDRAQLANDYDTELQQRVQSRITAGKQVRFVAVNSVLSIGDLYDGVHPTEAAADKVAQVWFDALTPTLP